MSQPTPRPWRVGPGPSIYGPEVLGPGDVLIAETPSGPFDELEANAEHIVLCVNAHDELVAALAESIDGLLNTYESHLKSEGKGCMCAYCALYRQRVNLLARARGEQP